MYVENPSSARQFSKAVDKYLATERSLNAIVGPFSVSPCETHLTNDDASYAQQLMHVNSGLILAS